MAFEVFLLPPTRSSTYLLLRWVKRHKVLQGVLVNGQYCYSLIQKQALVEAMASHIAITES